MESLPTIQGFPLLLIFSFTFIRKDGRANLRLLNKDTFTRVTEGSFKELNLFANGWASQFYLTKCLEG